MTADRDREIVVFHIGMRINAFWKVHRWLPVLLVAPRMVRELTDDPESGLLGNRTVVGPGVRNVGFSQYWESFDALRTYARDGDQLHFPVWREYYRDGTNDDASLGIWHETYVVRVQRFVLGDVGMGADRLDDLPGGVDHRPHPVRGRDHPSGRP